MKVQNVRSTIGCPFSTCYALTVSHKPRTMVAEDATMGWLIRDVVRRTRSEIGRFRYDEWHLCAEKLGLDIVEIEGLGMPKAILMDRTIVLRLGLDPDERARCAWHEIAHAVLHTGGAAFWASRPQGDIIVSKFERHANEFAALFPVKD